jgi:hypothetical protein
LFFLIRYLVDRDELITLKRHPGVWHADCVLHRFKGSFSSRYCGTLLVLFLAYFLITIFLHGLPRLGFCLVSHSHLYGASRTSHLQSFLVHHPVDLDELITLCLQKALSHFYALLIANCWITLLG